MSEEIQSGLISRRTAFSLISAVVGVALPATILAVSEAEVAKQEHLVAGD